MSSEFNFMSSSFLDILKDGASPVATQNESLSFGEAIGAMRDDNEGGLTKTEAQQQEANEVSESQQHTVPNGNALQNQEQPVAQQSDSPQSDAQQSNNPFAQSNASSPQDDFSSHVKSPEFQQQLKDLTDEDSGATPRNATATGEVSFASLIGLGGEEKDASLQEQTPPVQQTAAPPQHVPQQMHSTSSQPVHNQYFQPNQSPHYHAHQQQHHYSHNFQPQQHAHHHAPHGPGSANSSPHHGVVHQYNGVPTHQKHPHHPTIVPPTNSLPSSHHSTPHSRTSSAGSGYAGYNSRNASPHQSTMSGASPSPSSFGGGGSQSNNSTPHHYPQHQQHGAMYQPQQYGSNNSTPSGYSQNSTPASTHHYTAQHQSTPPRQFFSPSNSTQQHGAMQQQPHFSAQQHTTSSSHAANMDLYSAQSAPTPSFTPVSSGANIPQPTFHTPQHHLQHQHQPPFFSPAHQQPTLQVSPPPHQQHFQTHSSAYTPQIEHTFSPGHAFHQRQQSSEFSFDISGLAQNTMDEKLHNLSQKEARPIVSCGFGGRLVIMFPKRATRLNVMDKTPETVLPYSQNGEIRVYSLSKLLGNTDYGRALNQYPGVFPNTRKDAIISYINQIIMDYDRSVSVMGKSLTPEQLVEKQLWELLRLFVNIDRLTEDVVEDTLDNVKKILLSHKNQIEQWDGGAHANGGTSSGADMNLNTNAPNAMDLQHQQKVIEQMQKQLIDGRIEQACDIACAGHLWGHALLLASMIDKPTYTKVVTQFASNAFCHGSPLKTLYMMFADRGDLLFQAESQQLTDQFGNRYTSNSHQQQQQHQQQVDKLCRNWQENLAIIVANRTSSSGEVIEKLGDSLWREHGMVQSAHFCYLVGEFCTNFSNINNRVVLVGSDHRKRGAGSKPFASVFAIQRTEIYHHFKRRHNPKHISPSFMVFRLVYAFWLAEIGRVSLADMYVQDLLQHIEQLKETVSFNYTFLRQLNVLHDRIKGAGGSKRDSISLASGKSFFSSIFSRVDSTINNMMSSETTAESPSSMGPSVDVVGAVEKTPPPKKQNQNDNNDAAPASRSESSKEKGGGWLGWFSGKKKKRGANLGTVNTRKWSDKLQRYIPRDADEDSYVDKPFDAPPPPSMGGGDFGGAPSMGAPPHGMGAPDAAPSAASGGPPVFNSMTSRRYASYSSFAPQGVGMMPQAQPHRPNPAQMFMPQPMQPQQQLQQQGESPPQDQSQQQGDSPSNVALNAPMGGGGSAPINTAPPSFMPQQPGAFFMPQAMQPQQQQQPEEQQQGDNNFDNTYSSWSEPSWGEGDLQISGGWAEEPNAQQQQ